MIDKKPACQDFVLVAIRRVRVSNRKMKAGTTAAVGLRRLWSIASDVYDEAEFRLAVNALLAEGVLLATWHTQQYGRGSRPIRQVLVDQVPEDFDLAARYWLRGLDGKPVTEAERESVPHDFIREFKLYVAADGLPEQVRAISNRTAGSTASEIIAEMLRK